MSPLRLARLNLGRTLLEIQLATGISAPKLSAVERGLVPLRPRERRVLAEALGLDGPDSSVFDFLPERRILHPPYKPRQARRG